MWTMRPCMFKSSAEQAGSAKSQRVPVGHLKGILPCILQESTAVSHWGWCPFSPLCLVSPLSFILASLWVYLLHSVGNSWEQEGADGGGPGAAVLGRAEATCDALPLICSAMRSCSMEADLPACFVQNPWRQFVLKFRIEAIKFSFAAIYLVPLPWSPSHSLSVVTRTPEHLGILLHAGKNESCWRKPTAKQQLRKPELLW